MQTLATRRYIFTAAAVLYLAVVMLSMTANGTFFDRLVNRSFGDMIAMVTAAAILTVALMRFKRFHGPQMLGFVVLCFAILLMTSLILTPVTMALNIEGLMR